MPQMAPMNWTMLFITFCMIFLLFNSLNYFMFSYPVNTQSNIKTNKFTMNWKW
uniref:ATP synthase complex subunit 8 n=1 Tax=Ptilodactyla sp. PTY01 TaxID=1205576 RepID=A0A0S2MN02_9COLE|nr:ATP synthase F0 subunit 8 [Ptilodactyla sp. PTY01]